MRIKLIPVVEVNKLDLKNIKNLLFKFRSYGNKKADFQTKFLKQAKERKLRYNI